MRVVELREHTCFSCADQGPAPVVAQGTQHGLAAHVVALEQAVTACADESAPVVAECEGDQAPDKAKTARKAASRATAYTKKDLARVIQMRMLEQSKPLEAGRLDATAVGNALTGWVRGALSTNFLGQVKRAANVMIAGDEAKSIAHLPALVDALNAAGHKAKIEYIDEAGMIANLRKLAERAHEDAQKELPPKARKPFNASVVDEELTRASKHLKVGNKCVFGWHFAPKYMADGFDDHFVGAGFELIGIDAAHLKSGWGNGCIGGNLFTVASLTANRNLAPLVYSYLVATENAQSWQSVLRFARDTYKSLDSPTGSTVMDRDKGELLAHEEVLPLRKVFFCSEHFSDNLSKMLCANDKELGLELHLKMVAAQTRAECDAYFSFLPASAVKYITKIPNFREVLFPCYHPNKLHGWHTTSFVESANAANLTVRGLGPWSALWELLKVTEGRLRTQLKALSDDDTARCLLGPMDRHFPPAVRELLTLARDMAAQCNPELHQTTVLDQAQGIVSVGSLSGIAVAYRVSLRKYLCCDAMRVAGLPCPHFLLAAGKCRMPLDQVVPRCHL